jgi:hypothetical protein
MYKHTYIYVCTCNALTKTVAPNLRTECLIFKLHSQEKNVFFARTQKKLEMSVYEWIIYIR